MDNILEVINLKKEFTDWSNYKESFCLNNISFSVPKGYIMGFIGPNGSGKSTTIKLIMNLLKKDEGEIKIFGKDNVKFEKEIKEKIGFVYDENYYYENFTMKEIKKIIAPFYKYWDEETFQNYLERFDFKNTNKKIKTLSKGMKIKFSLAIALSHNADLIIMDEPTSGLDPVFRREILDILLELIQNENKSVFFSTHITTDLEKIADYITYINKGNIVFSKSKEEILDNYAIVKGDKNILNMHLKEKFIGIKENAFGFEALTDDVNEIQNLFGDSILIDSASLDDIMVFTSKNS
ncbi:ABC transporter ATP-binding protein [Clostridium cochlearium]|uniref:ABC transporter ATP-binding protein n=1 Tax=Clostridium cochlearium TaxID=1494 RepID=UPI0015701BC8|nr:ABC transporter ATP-binding protein [Clostridium cochlearium]MCG4578806.1 ABC transporter ATP-binding protein [Clostridium cochlearium]NSJ90885.1 ABC transporter ATP-binding protein [Coprococcus sp. MSK.21.13]